MSILINSNSTLLGYYSIVTINCLVSIILTLDESIISLRQLSLSKDMRGGYTIFYSFTVLIQFCII
jgi:hypothetical protein